MEFLKLEKIELAGLRGRSLSEIVLEMFNEFNELMNQFSGKSYDPLDISNKVLCAHLTQHSLVLVFFSLILFCMNGT